MKTSKVWNIVFAGGSCGINMVRVGEELVELCKNADVPINVKYVDLWVSDYLLPSTSLVVEMFPYYKNLDIPVLNGRPLLNPLEEKNQLVELVNYIKDLSKSDGSGNG